MDEENQYDWDSRKCQHEWEIVTYNTPILNMPNISNQQTSYRKCKQCGYEDRSIAQFSFNAPCAPIGVISDD